MRPTAGPAGSLRPEQRQLLDRLLEKRGIRRPQTGRIEPQSGNGPWPASFAQQRMWFLEQLNPGAPIYTILHAHRVSGPLRIEVLERSVNEIVRRHDILRTTFAVVEGIPQQTVAPHTWMTVPIHDLTHVPPGQQRAEVHRTAKDVGNRPFDLAGGPLIRIALLRLGPEEHVLVLGFHHIVFDGWSGDVFRSELAALYDAFLRGDPSPLAEPEIQYADFAVWQRNWLQGEVLDAQLAYWKERLGGDLPVLELPMDRVRPALQTFRGAKRFFQLPAELSDGLRAVSRDRQVTLYRTLLAAFHVLLHRYSGQDTVVTGSPIANRERTELEGVIGFFANTIALRADCAGNPPFVEFLDRVSAAANGALANQDVPFERLVDELHPQRNLSHHPLFQVMFVLQGRERRALELPGLTTEQIPLDTGVARFDLTLSIEDRGGPLGGSFAYNVDLFDPSTIDRMSRHFEVVLRGIVADPLCRLGDLPVLTEREWEQIVHGWNATQRAWPFPTDSRIHDLVREQTSRDPQATAVVDDAGRLTYAELHARANQLAHHLRALGVGPETVVGLCVDRGADLVVALLGILHAGGAYLPLDPTYPRDRLAFMASDAGVKVIVTQCALRDRLPETDGIVVCLDRDRELLEREPTDLPDVAVTASNLAYVIYTSGSTGKPKGALIEHRGLCNLTAAQIEAFAIDHQSRVLQFASISFDAATSEVFLALAAGAELHMASRGSLLPGPDLVRLLRDRKITTVTVPPTVLAAIDPEAVPGVKTVASVGEACTAELAGRWAVGRRFLNGYGPTEATVCAAISAPEDGSRRPPIGRPLANAQIYLLDRYRQPVPVGVPGELCVGGVGLARGYLNRPELTAERFVEHPFEADAEARLYRTGDLARYLPTGEIDYLGRIDHQVKLRGYRIELGEIEASLATHPAVDQAVVIRREDRPGDPRLVAYVVSPPPPDGAATPAALRALLRTTLPDHMVPAAFVALEAFPVTPNGKIDRRALPAPDPSRRGGQRHVPPTTETETELVRIWVELLGVEQVGIEDHFFDLGGHSLLATRLISRVRDVFGVDVPVRAIFEAPTVSGVAHRVDALRFLEQESTYRQVADVSEEREHFEI